MQIMVSILSAMGDVLDTRKAATVKNFCGLGQLYKGQRLVYVYGVGICAVNNDEQAHTAQIYEVLCDMDALRKKAAEYLKGKRFLVVTNDEQYVYFTEFLASRNLELILKCCSLNTTRTATGICFRDVKGHGETLRAAGNVLKRITVSEFKQRYSQYTQIIPESRFNVGNFTEFVLSGRITDIDEHRFDKKKQDVYIEGKRYELKSSTNLYPSKWSSNSMTNFVAKL